MYSCHIRANSQTKNYWPLRNNTNISWIHSYLIIQNEYSIQLANLICYLNWLFDLGLLFNIVEMILVLVCPTSKLLSLSPNCFCYKIVSWCPCQNSFRKYTFHQNNKCLSQIASIIPSYLQKKKNMLKILH